MSVQMENEPIRGVLVRAAGYGALAGFAGGLAMGIILQVGTDLLPVLGGLTGQRSVLRGWVVHLVISLIYGIVFSTFLSYPGLERVVPIRTTSEHILAGVVYATMIAAATIAVLPFAFEILQLTGGTSDPFPRIPGPATGALLAAAVFAIAHMIYGTILGGAYALLTELSPTE